ncbi:hypothetical protein AVEN_241282-1 [Araneus ventricosus]|uniref:T20D4.11-like domain-containing protein n=1 Tax=Araneus ventricosus TaxID=182803 RepID=A0A4Y2JIW7_ARAVE|nr:hypothetical protein AVEN_241282-1 [Araneus ventricosus]
MCRSNVVFFVWIAGNGIKKQLYCLAEKSIKCGMGFSEAAINVSRNLKHLCANGTVMNTEFEQHKKCFSEAGMSQVCFEPIDFVMQDRLDAKDVVLGQKITCKLLDVFSSCVVKSVEDECGESTVDFFSSLLDPLVRLSKGLCEEIIFPANENDDRPDNPGLMSVYQIIAVFFKSP